MSSQYIGNGYSPKDISACPGAACITDGGCGGNACAAAACVTNICGADACLAAGCLVNACILNGCAPVDGCTLNLMPGPLSEDSEK